MVFWGPQLVKSTISLGTLLASVSLKGRIRVCYEPWTWLCPRLAFSVHSWMNLERTVGNWLMSNKEGFSPLMGSRCLQSFVSRRRHVKKWEKPYLGSPLVGNPLLCSKSFGSLFILQVSTNAIMSFRSSTMLCLTVPVPIYYSVHSFSFFKALFF